MTKIESTLNKLGLNELEINVIQALYKLNQAKVSELSRESGLPRTSLYPVLDRLSQKSLIVRIKVANHYEWQAISPNELYLNYQEKLKDLKASLPLLEALVKHPSQEGKAGEVITYSTRAGLKKFYKSVFRLKRHERLYWIEGKGSAEAKLKRLSQDYILSWQKEFKKREIMLEAIIGPAAIRLVAKADEKIRIAHYDRLVIATLIPDEFMDFDAEIVSFKDTLIIIVAKHDQVIFINNSLIAATFKSLFKIMQQAGRRIDLNQELRKKQLE